LALPQDQAGPQHDNWLVQWLVQWLLHAGQLPPGMRAPQSHLAAAAVRAQQPHVQLWLLLPLRGLLRHRHHAQWLLQLRLHSAVPTPLLLLLSSR
jgi:hypothetical protein